MGGVEGRSRSVGVELARLVVIVALPLAGLIAYILYDAARRDEVHAAGLALQMAVTTADRAANYVETVRRALETVAKRPLIQAMDPEHCDPQLAELREFYGKPANIVVINLDVRIVCGATPPPKGVVVHTADLQLIPMLLARPRFRLSRPIIGQITKRWTVAAVQPVFAAGGKLVGAVAMGIDLEHWVSFSAIPGEPKGTIHDVITADGMVIARSQEPELWIGRNAGDSEVHRRMQVAIQGWARARSSEGTNRLWGFTPVAGTEWYARSSVSANRVFGPVRERALETAFLLAVVIGIAFIAVIASVARLVRPMQKISEALRSRSSGHGETHVPETGPREVAQLAAELNRMIDTGARREQDLRRFRAAMDISGDAILLVDRATLHYVDVNRTFCDM